MSLYRYFSPLKRPFLPDPEGESSSSGAAELRTINQETLSAGDSRRSKRKSINFYYDPETRARIGRFTAENGNKSATIFSYTTTDIPVKGGKRPKN